MNDEFANPTINQKEWDAVITAGGNVVFNGNSGLLAFGTNINQNITIIMMPTQENDLLNLGINETLSNIVIEYIEIARYLCDEKKDYNKALEYYEKSRIKLGELKSKSLLLKITVGEAVCQQRKGNLAKSKKLMFDAEIIDSENPTVLANIASLLKTEDPRKSEKYANRALKLDQHNILAKTVLGFIEYQRKGVEDAITIFKEALRIEPKNGYITYCISYIYCWENDYEKAIEYGIKSVDSDPDNPLYNEALGSFYLGASFPKGSYLDSDFKKLLNMKYANNAIEYLEKAKGLNELQKNPHLNYDIYINLGCAYFAKNKIEKSLSYLNIALDSGLQHDELYINLGMVYSKLNNYEKIIEFYKPLIEKGVNLHIVKANLAIAYLFTNKLEESQLLFEELINEETSHPYLRLQLALVYEKKGEIEKALNFLSGVRDDLKDYWEFNYSLGKLYYKIENYELGAKYLKKSIKQNNKSTDSLIKLINLYIECKMYQYAIEYAERLVTLDTKNKNTSLYNLAWLNYRAENYKKAVEILRVYFSLGFNDVEAHLLLYTSLFKLKEIFQAKISLENAIMKFPNNLILRIHYADILFYFDEIGKAIEIFSEIIKDDPNFTIAYLGLAKIYFWERDYEKAIENVNRSILIDPKNEYAYFLLSLSLSNSGRLEEGKSKLSKILEINPKSEYVKQIEPDMHQVELDTREKQLQNLIAEYEKGYITISKVAEISSLNINDLLHYMNNKKVLESIGISDKEIIHIENPIYFRKTAIIDDTMLILLARIKKLDLLRKAFDKIFIHKENEYEILIGEYQKNHPYRSIKKSLKIVKGGWIDSLKPSEIDVYASKKITDESMVSKKDIYFISLSLDNNHLCLTDDLRLRVELKRIRKNTCGLLGLLKYSVNESLIKKEEAEDALEIAKNIGYTPIFDILD